MASSFSNNLRGGNIRARKFKSDINVVPYIDVMLVLLVIFMVAAPMANPNVIDLPTAGKSTQPPAKYIQIDLKLNEKSSISVKQQQQENLETAEDRNDLLQKLRSLHQDHPDYPVMIAADKENKYDDVISMISEAKKMGIHRVALATK
jgi:biopolymer transport protein TolR